MSQAALLAVLRQRVAEVEVPGSAVSGKNAVSSIYGI
jgi:hypothetical protein